MRRPALIGAADEFLGGNMTEEKMLDRVRKLLDLASHANTSKEEAEAATDMADKLMSKYAIDAAMLRATLSKEERETPERRDVELFPPSMWRHTELTSLLDILSELTDVAVARIANGKHALVGYRDDIDYLELVFMATVTQFTAKVAPKWDVTLPRHHNVYNFKKAGFAWKEIWDAGWRASDPALPETYHGFFMRDYKRRAKELGDTEQVTTQRHEAYRQSYRAAFVRTIEDRVLRMKAGRLEDIGATTGAEIAIRDRRADVMEAFYQEFPELRPKSREQLREEAEAAREKLREEREKYRLWYEGLTPKQREMEDRKQERERQANARWWADYDRRNRPDDQGASAGRQAAATVDLSGGRNNLAGYKKELA